MGQQKDTQNHHAKPSTRIGKIQNLILRGRPTKPLKINVPTQTFSRYGMAVNQILVIVVKNRWKEGKP